MDNEGIGFADGLKSSPAATPKLSIVNYQLSIP